MRVWVSDLHYHLAMALRAVGVGLTAVAWASALGSEAQQSGDVRSYALVAAGGVAVLIVQWLTAPPPSFSVVELVRPLERDIVFVAREQARGDQDRLQRLVAEMALLAATRIRGGANLPRDRRAWLRALLRLAETDQA
jgi:hypothetical protein